VIYDKENKPLDFYEDTEIKSSCSSCDLCGDESTEFFYKDGNINNRGRSNLLFLCKKCYDGINDKPLQLTVFRDLSIEIAHKLPGHITCGVLHGHTVNITVGVSGSLNFATGMVMDFNDLKTVLKEVIEDKFDHAYLNYTFYMPTSEMLSLYIFNNLKRRGYNIKLVRVHETQKNYVEIGV